MQGNGFCWAPLLSQAEPQNSLCIILSLLPPHLQNKEAEREEASLQVELHTHMPQGACSLCRAVFPVLSYAASAYNISRKNP